MNGPVSAGFQPTYTPILELGRGGMAEVVLSLAEGGAGSNKLVVLKRIRAELTGDPESTRMFLDEGRLSVRLRHPNVLQTHDVGLDGDQYFIAMEYLEGQPLSAVRWPRRQDAPRLPLHLHLRVLSDALAGLHHAHELSDFDGTPLNVVHRDVSPQNVFITYDGHVKVLDFGVAKVVGASSETNKGMLKGKVAYMAPEQARGERVDRRADIFAVGIMLWEAITGSRFWGGTEDIAVIGRLLSDSLPTLRTEGDAPPFELLGIARRALAPSREERFATAAEMGMAIEAFLDQLPERSSPRELQAFVSAAFAGEQAKVKQAIETRLRELRWTGGPSSSGRPPPPSALSSFAPPSPQVVNLPPTARPPAFKASPTLISTGEPHRSTLRSLSTEGEPEFTASPTSLSGRQSVAVPAAGLSTRSALVISAGLLGAAGILAVTILLLRAPSSPVAPHDARAADSPQGMAPPPPAVASFSPLPASPSPASPLPAASALPASAVPGAPASDSAALAAPDPPPREPLARAKASAGASRTAPPAPRPRAGGGDEFGGRK